MFQTRHWAKVPVLGAVDQISLTNSRWFSNHKAVLPLVSTKLTALWQRKWLASNLHLLGGIYVAVSGWEVIQQHVDCNSRSLPLHYQISQTNFNNRQAPRLICIFNQLCHHYCLQLSTVVTLPLVYGTVCHTISLWHPPYLFSEHSITLIFLQVPSLTILSQ